VASNKKRGITPEKSCKITGEEQTLQEVIP